MLRSLGFALAFAVISATRIEKPRVPGAERRTVTDITLDASYEAGGEKVTPKDLGLTRVTQAICQVRQGSEAEATTVGSAWYEPPKQLLHIIDYKTQKEMAGAKDLSKVIVRVTAFGV